MTGVAPVGVSAQPDPTSLAQAQQSIQPSVGASAEHEQDFAAALERSPPLEQVDRQAASLGNSMMSTMTHRLDTIASGLRADPATDANEARRQVLFSGDPASAPPDQDAAPKSQKSLSAALDGALDSYRSSIVFSVEAQVASTGSTSSTKTFNDLMKGS